MNKEQSTYVLGGLVFLIAVAAAFFVGMHFQRNRTMVLGNSYRPVMQRDWGRQMPRRGMMGYGYGRRGWGGPLVGQVQSINGNRMVIKYSNGTTQTVSLTATTTYSKVDQVNKGSVSQGQTVVVSGSVTSDGSISAQDVRINPTLSPTPTP